MDIPRANIGYTTDIEWINKGYSADIQRINKMRKNTLLDIQIQQTAANRSKPQQTTANHSKPQQTTANHSKPQQTTANYSNNLKPIQKMLNLAIQKKEIVI